MVWLEHGGPLTHRVVVWIGLPTSFSPTSRIIPQLDLFTKPPHTVKDIFNALMNLDPSHAFAMFYSNTFKDLEGRFVVASGMLPQETSTSGFDLPSHGYIEHSSLSSAFVCRDILREADQTLEPMQQVLRVCGLTGRPMYILYIVPVGGALEEHESVLPAHVKLEGDRGQVAVLAKVNTTLAVREYDFYICVRRVLNAGFEA